MRKSVSLPLNKHRQAGLGIGAAIFLIMIVALLSAAIVRTVRTGAENYALELMGQRAFLVAQSGAQLAVRQVLPATGGSVCAAQTFTFATLDYAFCDATITCSQNSAQGRDVFTLTSRGRCSDGASTGAERVVEVQARSG